ncbi:MAG: 4-hydroxyphenylacetate 3-hydroxylase N-terminal domain-containing protein [Pseudomonadota bacterium]
MLSAEKLTPLKQVKDGNHHIESLKDGRTVYLNGEAITDVTTHKAFKRSVQTTAGLFDLQASAEHIDELTFESPTSGGRVGVSWLLPTSYEEMVKRREGLTLLAEQHVGFMGRSPDHLASALGGQVMGIEVFREYSPEYAANLENYFQYIRDNDHALTYVIINPQGNRSAAASEQQEDLVMRVVDEDDQGITVRGAKMLGTSAIMANEVFVANLQPLRPEEVSYATSFALPMNTPGLRVVSRKSFEESAESMFDNPLSSRFDENDALVYFDDVKVPRDRIFVNQNVEMCRKQFHSTPGHAFQNYQSQIRLAVKMRFLTGMAHKIAETIGTVNMPPVQTTLGKLASEAATIEALVCAMEASGQQYGDYYVPNKHMLYSAQVYTQELYPNFVNAIRELAGGSLIMLPASSRDFDNDIVAEIIERTQVSAGVTPTERVKFLKLAWDALGSEYAGRHLQYEMFYAGAQFVTRGHSYRNYDWGKATAMVDGILEGYSLDATD